MSNMPDSIVVEFLDRNGNPVLYRYLEDSFLHNAGIKKEQLNRPFCLEVERRKSKSGNAYYTYEQNSIPLPDGLNTQFKVHNKRVIFGEEYKSGKGHPTKKGLVIININNIEYNVLMYITKSKVPYYVKMHAQKATGSNVTAFSSTKDPHGAHYV